MPVLLSCLRREPRHGSIERRSRIRSSAPTVRAAAVALVGMAACRPGPPEASVSLSPCAWQGYEGELLCGTATVRENPERRRGRSIELEVALLPRTGGENTGEVATFLAGGGVLPATRYVPFFGRNLPELRERFDILLVNQRGSGGASELACSGLPPAIDVLTGETPASSYYSAVAACRDSLERRADLRQYTTDRAADDLDAIRRALGYESISVWATSYGTKVARVLARRHPGTVDAMALHGVVPLQQSMWPDLVPGGLVALDRLLARCEADGPCSRAYPDVSGALDSLFRRVRNDPVRVRLEDRVVVLDERTLARAVTGPLGEMAVARDLPRRIQRARGGDWLPLAAGLPRDPGGVAAGVYYSIACAEEFGRPGDLRGAQFAAPGGAAEARVARFGAFGSMERDANVCESWPKRLLPAGFWMPVESDVPTLILSGEDDFITPLAYGQLAAASLSRAAHLVLPHRSHNDLDPCVVGLIERFLLAPDAEVDRSCLEEGPAFRFTPPDP